MRLQSTMFVWKIMMIGLVLLLCGCGAPDTPRSGSSPDIPLLLAQSRWGSHRPARYRLVVQEDTAERSCRQAIDVRDERVQAVLEDQCGRATAWTISRMLEWISSSAQPASACDPASIACSCYVHQTTRAIYDPHQGYPYAITYQRTSAPNWSTLKLWWRLLGASALPNCAKGMSTNDQMLTIRVISLTALP
ncbi:MAG TPA: hypothetical protein VFU22_02895 [Roseiflexaceae bacterium]|nr:hypothetical protein [Roseiflexaceae bacterium]